MFNDFSEAEKYINDIPRFTGKNKPEDTGGFLNFLGDISEAIPVIHVAGTNGKGSVCAYLRSICMEAGMKVGMFTSPHLVSVCERFMFDGEYISEADFLLYSNKLLCKLDEYRKNVGCAGYHPSYFEFLFFIAVLWYSQKKPEVIILETGLGGRLDATNSISSPIATIITEIGFDHMEYLGDTIEAIAGEKAGIIKEGVPTVCVKKEKSYDVIAKKAVEKHSEIYSVNVGDCKEIVKNSEGIDFFTGSNYYKNVSFRLASCGLYQVENALLAINCISALDNRIGDYTISEDNIRSGLFKMSWSGRMERVNEHLVIDGAHNEDGIKAFLESVSEDGFSKRSLLYSAVADKQIEQITGMIVASGLFEKYYVCTLESYRAADMERLKKCFADCGNVFFANNTEEALKVMEQSADKDSMCYAVGSLYLVGEIKGILNDD